MTIYKQPNDIVVLDALNPNLNPIDMALVGFLARYREPTRTGYVTDLKQYLSWCGSNNMEPFEIKRPHLEIYVRWLEERGYALSTVSKRISTVSGFYRFAAIDGYITSNPAEYVRRPKYSNESSTNGLDRMEFGYLLACARAGSVRDYALTCLLGLMGLRVSEAIGLDIEDIGASRSHRTLTVLGKGNKTVTMPMSPPVIRAITTVVGERQEGPILLNHDGTSRMDRCAASRIVKRLAKAAGITKRISCHSLRHSAVTNALDAGVPLRDVQILARHADPRTTIRYDRNRQDLDRSAVYVLSAYIAGGA